MIGYWIIGIICITYASIRFNLSLWKESKTLHFSFFEVEHKTALTLALTPIFGQYHACKMTMRSLVILFSKKYRERMQEITTIDNQHILGE